MIINIKIAKNWILLLCLFLLLTGLIAAFYSGDKTESKADAFGSAGDRVSSANFETAFILGQSSPPDISESNSYCNIGGFLASFMTFGLPQEVDSTVAVLVPEEYALDQNYPNPFNPETTIKYQLPEAGRVVLKVYNTIGQEIRILVNEEKEAGYHFVFWNAKDNPSGMYLIRFQAGEFVQVKKCLIMK